MCLFLSPALSSIVRHTHKSQQSLQCMSSLMLSDCTVYLPCRSAPRYRDHAFCSPVAFCLRSIGPRARGAGNGCMSCRSAALHSWPGTCQFSRYCSGDHPHWLRPGFAARRTLSRPWWCNPLHTCTTHHQLPHLPACMKERSEDLPFPLPPGEWGRGCPSDVGPIIDIFVPCYIVLLFSSFHALHYWSVF